MASGINTRVISNLTVVAYQIGLSPKTAALQHNIKHNKQRDKDHHRQRDVPDKPLLAKRIEPVRKIRNAAIFDQHPC